MAPRQVVAIGWVVGLLLVVYVFGFEVAIPAFFLVYFGVMRAWRTALISAVAMWAVTYGLFEMALGVPLPHGLL
ncbi:tripartite tricarboxylate transporter TctB family protein [Streptomyces sp. NBC_01476]|uniref:tripartite tricarboxylate transporter TctB family protein n=1 Tax=Streptomyces sp. NBC_01476 TaxID=2903881 RepID=UPI002E363418|nr:tripartite tricarboxylate transporter TctB family protein [Streptomyces sp. NBC_01476]